MKKSQETKYKNKTQKRNNINSASRYNSYFANTCGSEYKLSTR